MNLFGGLKIDSFAFAYGYAPGGMFGSSLSCLGISVLFVLFYGVFMKVTSFMWVSLNYKYVIR